MFARNRPAAFLARLTFMSRSPAITIAAFATATMAATLAVAWPTTTHADGAAPLATYTVDGWKIGDVVAKGEIKRDGSAKSGWAITVTARNGADHAEDVPLETDVTRVAVSPMSRVMPRPLTVWSTREQVTVPAHGSITRRYELPAEVAAAVAAAQSAKKAPAKGPAMMTPVVAFAVAFDQQQAQGRPDAVDLANLKLHLPPVAD
jgi:hypothetical protein